MYHERLDEILALGQEADEARDGAFAGGPGADEDLERHGRRADQGHAGEAFDEAEQRVRERGAAEG